MTEHESDRYMPHVVKADRWHIRNLDQWYKVMIKQVLLVHRGPSFGSEDQFIFLPGIVGDQALELLPLVVLMQNCPGIRSKLNRPLDGLCFERCKYHPFPGQLPLNVEDPMLPFQIFPL